MKYLLLTISIFFSVFSVFGQAPDGFNYQAVVRDAGGVILTNQNVGIQFTIEQGSIGGTAVYTETFSATTNDYGLVNLEIGSGTTIDDFTLIDWSGGPYFIETAIDVTGGTSYVVMGTSQLVSVPYALHANTSENVVNDAVDDADADPSNELQDISLSGTDLSISSGSTVDLSAIDTDTQLSEVEVDAYVSNNGYLTSYAETDPVFGASPAASILGTDVTNWNSAYSWGDHSLAGYLTSYTETDPIFGASPASGILASDISDWNTAYSWGDHSLVGYLTSFTEVDPIYMSSPAAGITMPNILNWNSAFSWGDHALAGYLMSEVDGSVTNELQTLSVSGSDITISGGNTVTVPSDDDWTPTGATNIYRPSGNVGIGPAVPAARLHIVEGTTQSGLFVRHQVTSGSGTIYGSIDVDLAATSSGTHTQAFALRSAAERHNGPGEIYGGYFTSLNSYGASGAHAFGIYGLALRSISTAGAMAVGVFGSDLGSSGTSYAGYFSGDIWCTGSYLPSDNRLKSNVRPLEGALAQLKQLNSYTYEYKNDEFRNMNLPQGTQSGIMAQEVESVFPSLIKESIAPAVIVTEEQAIEMVGKGNYTINEDGMAVIGEDVPFKAVNYTGLIPVMIEAIKEQQDQINELKSELESLKQD